MVRDLPGASFEPGPLAWETKRILGESAAFPILQATPGCLESRLRNLAGTTFRPQILLRIQFFWPLCQ